ncbi:SapC protein, putative [Oceanicola granulosus HTCC2516]|uniref:SapC protein, putative n=1 Tax=Oceanicola granulosus (strain ATCC BAA-861 / DSM 15982 / KCTC 12143 / HTCC2516) TaxID=314256 RepID=Q2CHH1_OCEGH|nr:SapC family protein [Oceanicola granulosus]EAR52068.1 SapC protein, putative [Oceanicola granulosus HTCC2516]
MTTQLLFYQNPTPVSSERHLKTSVKTGGDFSFAKSVNSVPLVAAEFAEAGAEFPIVFAGEGDTVVPTVILGAMGSENAYIDDDGKWTAKYMPLFIRRYPFVFSHQTSEGQLILHVDEAYSGVNKDDRGERLFDSDGSQTQYLKSVLRFLEDYQLKFNRSQQYCKRLVEHDLLRPMEAQFTLPSGERRKLTGFRTVDRDKLKALGQDVVEQMLRTDELECTFLHLASLRHFASVAERSGGGKTAEAPTPDAAEAQEGVVEDVDG